MNYKKVRRKGALIVSEPDVNEEPLVSIVVSTPARLDREIVRSPQDVHALMTRLKWADREHMIALLMDCKNRIIRQWTVSIGSLGASLVHPREVYRPALVFGASAVIVVHNHPSGDPCPSLEDRQVTKRLREAGEMMGIPLLDHVIVGSEGYYSFADAGE